MATAVLTLTGTKTAQWDQTPAGPAHHTLIDDDPYPPGDQTNYVQCNGHVAGLIEEYYLSAGPADVFLVTNVNLKMFGEGIPITNTPAFRVELYVSDVKVGQRSFSHAEEEPSEASLNFAVNINGQDWKNSTRVIRVVPIDGNANYGPIPHDPG